MNAPREWRLPADADDWQCDWESSRRFQLLYFRDLPLADKISAVEAMCRLAHRFAPCSIPSPPDADAASPPQAG